MLHRNLIGQRLLASFVLGWLLFNFPLLIIFNDTDTWFGIPKLYAYLFGAWALFIALTAFIVEHGARKKAPLLPASPASRLKD